MATDAYAEGIAAARRAHGVLFDQAAEDIAELKSIFSDADALTARIVAASHDCPVCQGQR